MVEKSTTEVDGCVDVRAEEVDSAEVDDAVMVVATGTVVAVKSGVDVDFCSWYCLNC